MVVQNVGAGCVGAQLQGTLIQLVATGALNVALTCQPQVTFWKACHKRYTNFVIEAITQPFNTQVGFGSQAQITLNRNGDLIFYQYVVIGLPGITAVAGAIPGGVQFPASDACDPVGDGPLPDICPCGPAPSQVLAEETLEAGTDNFLGLVQDIDRCTGLTTPYAHYTNAIGQFLLKQVCLVIGGQVVDTLYNDYLFMWEELSGQPGKRLTEMIGKRFTVAQLVADSKEDRILYVPLPFWYTRHSGNALALVALQFHGVQIHVQFADLKDSVQVSDANASVIKCSTCQPLTNSDLAAAIQTTYVYLDCEERDRFACSNADQLITQVQALYMCTQACQIRARLDFNHPVIELIWAVRRAKQEAINNWFNYSGKFGRDPITFAVLKFNNLPRVSQPAQWYRLVQPYQFHTDIPDAFIYVYSFALYPEDPIQPSGTANFSRIDNIELTMDLQTSINGLPLNVVNAGGLDQETVTLIVFARNYNIFRYREGLGGNLYQAGGQTSVSKCKSTGGKAPRAIRV